MQRLHHRERAATQPPPRCAFVRYYEYTHEKFFRRFCTHICTYKLIKRGVFMKNERLDIRLSSKHLELIKRVASQFDMDVTTFILAVLIPYCLKVDKSDK